MIIDPKSIAYCQDGRSIFDKQYNKFLQDMIGVQGWEDITVDLLPKVLNNTFWYHKYVAKMSLHKLLKTPDHMTDDEMKTAVKQTIFTINGLLIKRFLAFPDMIVSYKIIAKQTAELFSDLIRDYTKEPGIEQESIFLEIKEFLNYVKGNFHLNDAQTRIDLLVNFPFKFQSVGRFFVERLYLYEYCIKYYNNTNQDYTGSVTWFYRMSILHQTRVLGYLPRHVSWSKGIAYRDYIIQPEEKPELNLLEFIGKAIIEEFKFQRIPINALWKYRFDKMDISDEEEKLSELDESINQGLDFIVKDTASVTQPVSKGGKLEDARQLLLVIEANGWLIPIRDLDTHEIIDFIEYNRNKENIHETLFWFSYQIMINHLIELKRWKGIDHYFPFWFKSGNQYECPQLFDARIAIIKEPGKDRILTMSHSFFTWFLTPGGKLLNSCISLLDSHKTGLRGASDDWVFSQRMAAGSSESEFIYRYKEDPLKRKSTIWAIFQDWKEATDNINRYKGLMMVKALFQYHGFPDNYGRLILACLSVNQHVKQSVPIIDEDTGITQSFLWNGDICRGFMMGNPITKSILHCCHIVETVAARIELGHTMEPKRVNIYGNSSQNLKLNRRSVGNPPIQTFPK